MGLFSSVFNGIKNVGHGITGYQRTSYFRGVTRHNQRTRKRGGYGGGYGAWTFKNIIDAHSDAEDIVEEFGLDQEDAQYGDCYARAYRECLDEAMTEMIAAGDFDGDPEDYIDWDELEELAFEYAVELAESYINGDVWIPEEIIMWAYYEVSSHNG